MGGFFLRGNFGTQNGLECIKNLHIFRHIAQCYAVVFLSFRQLDVNVSQVLTIIFYTTVF